MPAMLSARRDLEDDSAPEARAESRGRAVKGGGRCAFLGLAHVRVVRKSPLLSSASGAEIMIEFRGCRRGPAFASRSVAMCDTSQPLRQTVASHHCLWRGSPGGR
jgi:hypothetical protein